ncbi:hypothetical protein JMJ77_0004914 [Colletotrichum scovillei]|uniref:Uncharacterized protein n=2 Tax=Colletotrichum scovillei TaxID=1209932 RepID=A0A9P7RG70_9PEZI|nr:hypothetical protein JMJ77_0004914 [Colletotrichum scovillei]KAG7076091.1 hypothetical protein JMJ76_0013362 [Colletotrichum scovillei]KAG7083226.1 hypothetical protein JMJ78_0008675 [Colletotrichum scovillei]
MTRFKSSKPKFKPEHDGSECKHPPSYSQRLQQGLGSLGLATVGGGTALILALLGFLLFLWTGEGSQDGRTAATLWRWIMLNQHITQAITLSTVLLRIAVTAQASIYTSLLAGVVLEKHGVPLFRVAEMSIIRCTNDGPFQLTWVLLTSARKAYMQIGLAVLLLLTTFVVQFSSTLLVSDLGMDDLVGDAKAKTFSVHMSRDVISLNRQMNNWISRPTAYVPFGEPPLETNTTTYIQSSFSDTGIVRRTFLPLSTSQMSTLREYTGGAYGFESRFVCLRPSVSAFLSVTVPAPGLDTVPFYLNVAGSISYETMFREPGLTLPENCENGSCFPSGFNCSLPQFQYTETQARQGFTNSLCIPNGTATRPSARNHTISGDPIAAYSQVFLFFRNNGTHDLWKGPGNRVLVGTFGLNNVSSTDGEWLTYNRPISGRLPTGERIETGVLRLDVSLCFQQLAFNFAEVKLSSKKDLKESQVTWTPATKAWNTKKIQKLMGVGVHNKSPNSRGIFSVDSVKNPRHLNATQYLTNKLINDLYNSPRTFNFSLFMDPQGSGNSPIKPHVEYQAIFADILNVTNRPGVAMQSTLTALSGSIINEALPQFDVQANAILTSSVRVMTPKSLRGLLIIFGVMALNMACDLAVVLVFMVQSRYSSQGNYWQGVAQIVSDETAWILEGATEASDGHVKDE